MSGFGADVQIEWPGPSFPATGSAVPRTELDDRIRSVAVDDGAKMLLGVKAVGVEHDSRGRVTSVTLEDGSTVGCRGVDRRRRRPLDARPVARPRMAQGDRLRRGDPRLPRHPAQQRTVDHLAPGTALPGGRGAARLRLDLPARQRRGEHRRRRAGHVEAARRRGAAPAAVALHRPAARRVGLRRRTARGAVGAAADGRRGVRRRRTQLDADRRRRRLRQPPQRRGHRLRTRDRPAGRRDAGHRRPDPGVARRTAPALRPRILRRATAGAVADHSPLPADRRARSPCARTSSWRWPSA